MILCESSGVMREAFRRLGHDAYSCDLLPADDGSEFHFQEDALEVAYRPAPNGEPWDLAIAHPECTYVCSSGLHWNNRVPGRAEKTNAALMFITELWECPAEKMILENPVGCINTRLPFMPRPQYVQPHWFGDDASKKTGLWCRGGIPEFVPTNPVPGRIVMHNGKEVERWANQTDSGQNRLGPSDDRWKERSKTYSGLANAVATQVSAVL